MLYLIIVTGYHGQSSTAGCQHLRLQSMALSIASNLPHEVYNYLQIHSMHACMCQVARVVAAEHNAVAVLLQASSNSALLARCCVC